MLIRSRMGVTADGFVADQAGIPAIALQPGFEPGVSHGFPEFFASCDSVVMGRSTFTAGVQAPRFPWPGVSVYVLTSQPLPGGSPDGVTAAASATELAQLLRGRGSDADVHLVGGPQTIRAFYEAGELDRLELVLLPVLLGTGVPLSPPDSPAMPLRLLRSERVFADGSAELVYAPGKEQAA
ncbi:MAG TPA: dihydrofolate reductase family protein [Streptosporangiaceae bacterium]|nr:dihydrofolate reductase family protein [Streptosporangiaceae bacterium]